MISFSKLTFKNILSVGNQPVSVDLNECKTTLVHGTNGSGKSTILDALTYSLFGKSFRGVNLSQLVNTQNKKGMLVEVEFSIGKDSYLVRRGMKPRVFEIFKNNEIIDKKAADKDNQAYLENTVLKLSYKSFTQIVILGSSNFIPFMQMNAVGRRECVEDFLDIKVFSTMAVMAKERLRGLKETLRYKQNELETINFKIETLEDKIKQMSERDEAELEGYKSQIRQHDVESHNITQQLMMWYKNIETQQELIDEVTEKKPVEKQRQLNNVLIKLNTKLERLVKEKAFFDQDDCPTCGQAIEFALKTAAQGNLQKEIEEVDKASVQASTMLQSQAEELDVLKELNDKMREFNKEVFELQTQQRSHNDSVLSLQKRMKMVEEAVANVNQEQGVLDQLKLDRIYLVDEINKLIDEVASHDMVVELLKDSGIKTQIVKKYLPAMNKYIRHYLNELDFPIHFQLDSEFNEQVSSPLHQDFSYQSFSEGQKGRIDLALMFCWRDICALKNSVSTNLLILDEVFSSSLDETGKDCLLALLRYRLPDNQRIVVVDHTLSGTFKEKFEKSIEVTRKGGFSSYGT